MNEESDVDWLINARVSHYLVMEAMAVLPYEVSPAISYLEAYTFRNL